MRKDRLREGIYRAVPSEARAFIALASAKKAQGSLEYIMMVAAASIVIVIALAMVVKLKGSVASNVTINGNTMSASQAIATEIANLSNTIA
ncbi:MAG: class III signal peptide-containing protein [Candidatus Marsarchaeota archaeon]|nr:class III signal peptide-containing protein [Candidatus Marsarchaeota archaeon]